MKSEIIGIKAEDRGKAELLTVPELLELYNPINEQIKLRLAEFRHIWETANDEDLFRELVFCLLTPQSKARVCWRAVQRLERKRLIAGGEPCEVQEQLVGVRFNQRKSE